jgi:hypothetical protein
MVDMEMNTSFRYSDNVNEGGILTLKFQDSENLVTGDESNLRNPMGITKIDANLRGHEAFTGEFSEFAYDIERSR